MFSLNNLIQIGTSGPVVKQSLSESGDTQRHLTQAFIDSIRKLPSAASLAQLKAHLCMREHLSHDECERALIPSLEHASLVHSHIYPTENNTNDKTQNAIIYITLIIIVYVVVVVWFIAVNFARPARSQFSFSYARQRLGQIVPKNRPCDEEETDEDDDFLNDLNETEALLVVRDFGGRGQARSSTCLLPEENDGVQV